MRLEDPETPSGSQLSTHVSNPSGIASQRRKLSAWVTTGHVEHRAINQVHYLNRTPALYQNQPPEGYDEYYARRVCRQQFQDEVAQEMRNSLCSYGGAIGWRAASAVVQH
jgi:hypothetical protein